MQKQNQKQQQKAQENMLRPLLSIAPMVDVTYTHFRYFMRLLTKKAVLYTQMLHHGAVIHNHQQVLPFNPIEHPIVLQLGGCDPKLLADAAEIGERYGYDEINLNVGCPSPRVQEGSFGACLMRQPELVYECMESMAKRVKIPVTVKCRLGVDDFKDYDFVKNFVRIVSNDQKGSVKHFIIHSRIALLKGLNPAQNRKIPPIQYQKVLQLQKDFPELKFTINGQIKTIKRAKQFIEKDGLHGVMIGRTAYENTYELITADQQLYGQKTMTEQQKTRKHILYKYAQYVQKLQKNELKDQLGNLIPHYCNTGLIKPILTMYNNMRGCAKYRQMLSDHSQLKNKYLPDVIRAAADFMEEMKVEAIRIEEEKARKREGEIAAQLEKMNLKEGNQEMKTQKGKQKEQQNEGKREQLKDRPKQAEVAQ